MNECIYVCIMCVCMYIKLLLGVHCSPVPSQARVQEEGWWRGADTAAVENRLMKSNGRRRRVNGKHPDVEGEGKGVGHQHGRNPMQDTRASPNSLETHLVRKRGDIGHLRAPRPWSNGWMDGMNICMFAFTEGVLS